MRHRAPGFRFVWWWCVLLLWGVQAHGQDAAAETAGQEKPRFDVREFRVQGNTLLTARQVERALYPLLGSGKSADDVETARKALAHVYGDAGYGTVIVTIPEQEVNHGVVYLQVTEGRIGHAYVTGAEYYSPVRIRERLPALEDNGVLHLPSLQSQLAAINTPSGDRVLTPVLRAGRTPGTVDVEVKVRDKLPLHGSIEANDRYSANTSHLRLEAQLGYDNLWQREHSLSFQYQTSPEQTGEVQVLAGTYVWRDFSEHTILAIYGAHSESQVAAVGSFRMLGKGDIFGARLIAPLSVHEKYSHNFTLGVDYKAFAEDLALAGSSVPVTTPISYIPFSIAYSGTRGTETMVTRFDAGLHFGVRGVGDDEIGCEYQNADGSIGLQRINEFACKRAGARPNFVYLTFGIEQTRELLRKFPLRTALRGQLADSPLINNEQFSAGGAESVRGYLESERLGDNGAQLNLELSSPSFITPGWRGVQDLRVMLFADAAHLDIKEALPGQRSHFDLSGAGMGLNAKAWGGLRAVLDMAWPFADGAETKAGDPRVHFSVAYQF